MLETRHFRERAMEYARATKRANVITQVFDSRARRALVWKQNLTSFKGYVMQYGAVFPLT